MINFPKSLKFSEADIKKARAHADRKRMNMNSYEGAFRGELAEIVLARELEKNHKVVENDEDKTRQYEWDLKVDETYVDVKTSAGKTITVGYLTLEHDTKNYLFPCYAYKDTHFDLLGVLSGAQIKELIQDSNYGGFFIWNKTVVEHSIQKGK